MQGASSGDTLIREVLSAAGTRPDWSDSTPAPNPAMTPMLAKVRVAGVRRIVQLLFAICLSSCATTPRQTNAPTGPAPDISVSTSGHWVKVRSNPPTWYPRGTRSDCPTDFRSGEWVVTGDHDGTRYFIPLHVTGEIPRKALVKEALAARGPDVCRPPTGEKFASFAKVVGNIVVGPPLLLMTLYGAKRGPQEDFTVDKKTISPFDP